MKELSVSEMNAVSGGYSLEMCKGICGFMGSIAANVVEAASSIVLGATAGSAAGAIIGGRHGGDGGGVLGVGTIGQGVGMVYGAIQGGITGGIAGALTGWDTTLEYAKKAADGVINGTIS